MSKIEKDRPDWHRGNTFVTLGEAQDRVIADAVKAARAEQMSVLGTVGGPVGVSVGETTATRNDRVDSQPLDPALIIRRLTNELAQARLVANQARLKTAQALADVAAARQALELSIKHQDQRHTEAMAKQKASHDAKVSERDGQITKLANKLKQVSKERDDVIAAITQSVAPKCPVDAVEWAWNQPHGLLPRGMR